MIRSAVTVSLVPEVRGGPFVFWDDGSAAAAKAKALGFDAIEVFPPSGVAVEPKLLRCILDDNGLSLAAVGTGAGWVKHRLHLCLPDARLRAKARAFIKTIIDFAAAIRSRRRSWGQCKAGPKGVVDAFDGSRLPARRARRPRPPMRPNTACAAAVTNLSTAMKPTWRRRSPPSVDLPKSLKERECQAVGRSVSHEHRRNQHRGRPSCDGGVRRSHPFRRFESPGCGVGAHRLHPHRHRVARDQVRRLSFGGSVRLPGPRHGGEANNRYVSVRCFS